MGNSRTPVWGVSWPGRPNAGGAGEYDGVECIDPLGNRVGMGADGNPWLLGQVSPLPISPRCLKCTGLQAHSFGMVL